MAEAGIATRVTVERVSAVRAWSFQTSAFRASTSIPGGVHQRQVFGKSSGW
jgi:hypothetical protein